MDWIILILLFLVLLFLFFIWKRISVKESVNQTDLLRRDIQQGFDRIEKNFREDFKLNREESRMVAKENRAELANSMNEFRAAFDRGIASFNALQREKFASLNEQQQLLVNHTEKRLEEIRITVEEKLQKTLNERISSRSASSTNNWRMCRKVWVKCRLWRRM